MAHARHLAFRNRGRRAVDDTLARTSRHRRQCRATEAGSRCRFFRRRGQHILLWLALEGAICLAGREGKQHTFALLDDWVPKGRDLDRDEALTELALRYYTSHGHATLQDLMWWAGITAKDATAALENARRHLVREVFDGRVYWLADQRPSRRSPSRNAPRPLVKLLPAYDEYTVAYRDRSLLAAGPGKPMSAGFGLLNPVVVVDGAVAGRWKRTFAAGPVRIDTQLRRSFTRLEKEAMRLEIEKLREFLGRS